MLSILYFKEVLNQNQNLMALVPVVNYLLIFQFLNQAIMRKNFSFLRVRLLDLFGLCWNKKKNTCMIRNCIVGVDIMILSLILKSIWKLKDYGDINP